MQNKKRALAQRIGETGEALVRLWASKNCLSANKMDNDYGFDFILQHFKPYGQNQIHTGIWFLAQCKAIEQENPKYVKLEKSDAYLYLSASVQCCLLSVNNKDEKIKFRFVDQELIDKLITFVNSSNESLNLNIEKYFFQNEQLLQDYIKSHANSSEIQKLKIYIAKQLLSKLAPNLSLATTITDEDYSIHLKSNWLTNVINPDLLFSNESKSADYVIDFNVIEILRKYLPSFNVVSISGSISTGSVLSGYNSQNVTKCVSYPHKGNVSFRTKIGFVLTAGPCIKENGQHIHKVKYEIKPAPYSFAECREDCLAFEEMFEQKKLAIDNHLLIPDLGTWKEMESFFFISKEISNAINSKIFEFPGLQACDIENYDVSVTIGIITSLINRKTLSPWFPGFLFNCTETPINELEEIPCTGSIPLVFSLKRKNYIVWLSSSYSWLLDKSINQIIGFKINQITKIDVNELEWNDREIPTPELWIESFWPAIPLDIKNTEVKHINEDRPYSIIENKIT